MFVYFDHLLHRLIIIDEHIDDSEDLLELELDQRRNEIVALNLMVASVATAFGFSAVIAGYFGMNLYNSNLSSVPWVLAVVIIGSIALSVLSLVVVVWYVRRRKLLFIPTQL